MYFCCPHAIQNKSIGEREFYKCELVLAELALAAYDAVVCADGDWANNLKRYKFRFTQEATSGSGVSSGSAGSGRKPHTIGSSPPTGSIQLLKHVSEIREYIELVDSRVGSRDDLKVLKSEFTRDCRPWRDLIKCLKDRAQMIISRRENLADVVKGKYGNLSLPKVREIPLSSFVVCVVCV